jgi:hypothetical protein
VDYYRQQFADELQRNSPNVIIVSNEWYDEQPSLDKINAWPWMAQYLAENFHPVVTRRFTDFPRSAYRIYVRNGYRY